MKHSITFFAVLMMAMAMPKVASAYDFSAVTPSGHTLYYSIISDFVVVSGNNVGITGDLVIPSSVTFEGVIYPVTRIGLAAFSGCNGLISVTIPNSVTHINDAAFNDCTGLNSVTFGNSVTSIGEQAFRNCTSLTSVTIPNSVTSIKSEAFWGCTSLTSFTIPNSVTNIGSYVFYNCTGLTSVTIPNSVTSINGGFFEGCSSLTFVTIPNSVTTINGSAFRNCTGLISITIPNSVTSIGFEAFAYCTGLTSVTIGNSVTSIEYFAFAGCTNLTTINVLPIIPPDLVVSGGMSSFFPGTSSFIVPCGSLYDYQHASGWTNYSSNMEESLLPNFNYDFASNDTTMGIVSIGVVDCNVVVSATANAGYQFSGWSDGNTDNPRTLILTQDTSLQAIFEITTYTVMTTGAYGGGIYAHGSTATLIALPQVNGQFAGWSDGETVNPRAFVVMSDTTIDALFVAPDTIHIYDTVINIVYDTVINIIYDTTEYNHYYYDTTRIYDTLIVYDTTRVYDTLVYVNIDTLNHYYYDTTRVCDTMVNIIYDTTRFFDTIIHVNVDTLNHYFFDTTRIFDTLVYVNVDTLNHYFYDTIRVFDTMVYVNVDTLNHYFYDTTWVFDTMVCVNVDTLNHYYYDTTEYNHYHFDTTVMTHYIFDSTWVFDTLYIVDTVYLHDTVYITQGIDGVDALNAKVYSSQGQIVVEGADGNMVTLFDVNGRVLATKQDYGTEIRFDAPVSGTYMIKIGNYPARKVVVIR